MPYLPLSQIATEEHQLDAEKVTFLTRSIPGTTSPARLRFAKTASFPKHTPFPTRRSRIVKPSTYQPEFSEVGSTGEAFPFAEIHLRTNSQDMVTNELPSAQNRSQQSANQGSERLTCRRTGETDEG